MARKKVKVKVIYKRTWETEEFEEIIHKHILEGYTPKYESFRISFNDSGGPGHYFILMEKNGNGKSSKI